jgi:zinc/manganese transport system substrate-binding protein/zinc transport system substrate-binding protein
MMQFCFGVACLLLFCLGWAMPAGADDVLRVVTTTTDLKSLVEVVGGDRVTVKSIALPAQDPHSFEPRPSDFQLLRGAQMVVKVGLDHDLWIDALLAETGGQEIQRGGAGYVDASVGIPLLEVRSTSIAPIDGHSHGAGNPHYWLDPANAEVITGGILEGLERIDPDYAAMYEANRSRFLAQLQDRLNTWEQQLAPFRGQPIVAYHNSWPYLARRFRLNLLDFIEPKPGIPPSPTRLAALLREIKDRQVKVIIREPYESDRVPRLLSSKTGVPVVTLVSSIGAIPQAQDYFSLFDYNIGALEASLKAALEASNG